MTYITKTPINVKNFVQVQGNTHGDVKPVVGLVAMKDGTFIVDNGSGLFVQATSATATAGQPVFLLAEATTATTPSGTKVAVVEPKDEKFVVKFNAESGTLSSSSIGKRVSFGATGVGLDVATIVATGPFVITAFISSTQGEARLV
jgi:hypothetical protein